MMITCGNHQPSGRRSCMGTFGRSMTALGAADECARRAGCSAYVIHAVRSGNGEFSHVGAQIHRLSPSSDCGPAGPVYQASATTLS